MEYSSRLLLGEMEGKRGGGSKGGVERGEMPWGDVG
jgi:hypothetical protein